MIPRSLILVCVGAMYLPAALADAGRIRITLQPEVSVQTMNYRLGDIARIEPSTAAASLSGLIIGRTPRPGQHAQITRFDIGSRLERLRAGSGARIQWRGAPWVKLRGAGAGYDTAIFEPPARVLLHEWITARLAQPQDAEIELRRVGRAETLVLPQGRVTVKPRLAGATRLRQRMRVWLDVKVDGEVFQTLPLWFAVSVRAPVLVADRTLSRHSLYSRGDWSLQQRDIAGLASAPVTGDVNGIQWLLRDLPAGGVLTEDLIGLRPPVRKGEEITVVTRHGLVAVATRGLALNDGALAERIRVENPANGKRYSAIVTGDRIARVD